jgi:TrmH family RNA methyltransferase
LFVALSDPTNLGALIRTCAAFDWQQIVLLKEAAHPFLPKAIRAASGTCFASRFFEGPSIKDLSDPEILALDMEGRNLKKSDIPKNLKLLVGEEGQGVPSTFPGRKVQIPISNRVESLNATIAASFLVYEWSKNH